MLNHLQIKNFKAWKDTGPIRLAPLTVLFGANSAGKSSLGHLLLGLKQTALLTDRRRALHLGDANSLIDLGTFADCLHNHDLKAKLDFELAWRTPDKLDFQDPLQPGQSYRGNHVCLSSVLRAGPHQLPELEKFEYQLLDSAGETILDAKHGVRGNGKPYLEVAPLKLIKKQGRKWPIERPEKFYRFSDVTLARFQNADSLSELPLETERMLGSLTYLGPLRARPKRTYSWAGDIVPDVGEDGRLSIPALLAATQEGRELNRGRRHKKHPFDQFIALWLRDLGVISSFSVQPVAKGRKEYEVLVRTTKSGPQVKLTDVGFGVSQMLPALVQAFYAPPDSIVWMEQPEIHLHPQVQSELADAMICATQAYENGRPRNVQLIIESHSEHFLTRLQRRIAEEKIKPQEVAVYFARPSGSGLDLEELRLDTYGNIENWPDHFFGDEMAEVAGRTKAAMQRQIRDRESRHD